MTTDIVGCMKVRTLQWHFCDFSAVIQVTLTSKQKVVNVIPLHRNAALCCRPTAAVTSTRLCAENNDRLLAVHEAPPPHCWLPSNHDHPPDRATCTTCFVGSHKRRLLTQVCSQSSMTARLCVKRTFRITRTCLYCKWHQKDNVHVATCLQSGISYCSEWGIATDAEPQARMSLPTSLHILADRNSNANSDSCLCKPVQT